MFSEKLKFLSVIAEIVQYEKKKSYFKHRSYSNSTDQILERTYLSCQFVKFSDAKLSLTIEINEKKITSMRVCREIKFSSLEILCFRHSFDDLFFMTLKIWLTFISEWHRRQILTMRWSWRWMWHNEKLIMNLLFINWELTKLKISEVLRHKSDVSRLEKHFWWRCA